MKRGGLKKVFQAAALIVATVVVPVSADATTHSGADPDGYINLPDRTSLQARIEHVSGLRVDKKHAIVLDGKNFMMPGPYDWQLAVLVDKALMKAAESDPNVRTIIVDFNGVATPNRNLPVFGYDKDFRHLSTSWGEVTDLHPLSKLSRKSLEQIKKAGGFAIRIRP